MTVDQVEKHRFWVDQQGCLWERVSYCLQPTATFQRVASYSPSVDLPKTRLGGAIGCLNFEGLEPIEHPLLDKRSTNENS